MFSGLPTTLSDSTGITIPELPVDIPIPVNLRDKPIQGILPDIPTIIDIANPPELGSNFSGILPTVEHVVTHPVETLGEGVTAVAKPVAGVGDTVAKPVANVVDTVAKPVTNVVDVVAKPVTSAAKFTLGAVDGVAEGTVKTVGDAVESTVKAVGDTAKAVNDGLPGLDSLQSILANVSLEGIKNFIKNFSWDFVVAFIKGVIAKIGQ